MYCTADSCAEACDTKTSPSNNPRTELSFRPEQLLRVSVSLAFNLRPVNCQNLP